MGDVRKEFKGRMKDEQGEDDSSRKKIEKNEGRRHRSELREKQSMMTDAEW